jgi:hypothetical protein
MKGKGEIKHDIYLFSRLGSTQLVFRSNDSYPFTIKVKSTGMSLSFDQSISFPPAHLTVRAVGRE